MQVLQYLLDDVSKFLSTKFVPVEREKEEAEDKGCLFVLKGFIDHITERETENFRSRREDNRNSVTLTTIHQVFSLLLILLAQNHCLLFVLFPFFFSIGA